MPRDVGGRSMYMASPEYMASYARHLIHAGAKIVGGCCGTTPAHIRAIVQGVRPLAPRIVATGITDRGAGTAGTGKREQGTGAASSELSASSPSSPFPLPASLSKGCVPIPFEQRSHFAAKIARGEMVTSVEIVPPRGVDASKMLSDVAALKREGVDAVNVPDGPRAQSRMGAVMTSLLIEQQVGIESVTHYCCRDRNLLGMLSDLLGASAMGLRNILLITGDPPKMGPYPDATAVFDIDAIGLTNLVNNLNHGLDPGGNPIGAPTRYAIGVGVNPAAVDPAMELRRFEYKVEAGAEYAITQPVFDVAQLERFLGEIRACADSDHCGHLAAGVRAQRGVPRQRGAWRGGTRVDHHPHATREREVEGARGRRGDRHRARDALVREVGGSRGSGIRPVRQSRARAGRISVRLRARAAASDTLTAARRGRELRAGATSRRTLSRTAACR